MSGTVEGGKKAAATNLKKDPNFYKRIAAQGGRNGRTGGFYVNRELAKTAGAAGGAISKRGYRFLGYDKDGNPGYAPKD